MLFWENLFDKLKYLKATKEQKELLGSLKARECCLGFNASFKKRIG